MTRATKRGARGVRARAVAAMVAAMLATGALACAGPSTIPPRTVSLRMAGSPPQATVTIDDQLVGELAYVADHGVALPPGVHHVTVQARGYFPWDKEIDAKLTSAPAPIRLDVRLVPVPD